MCDARSDEEEPLPDLPEFDGDFEQATNEGAASVDEVLDCLSHPVRRQALYYCQENQIAKVSELAKHIAAMENNVPVQKISDEQRKQFETQLVHTHLPKLVESNILEYDRRSLTVRYDDPPRILDWLLQALAKLEE